MCFCRFWPKSAIWSTCKTTRNSLIFRGAPENTPKSPLLIKPQKQWKPNRSMQFWEGLWVCHLSRMQFGWLFAVYLQLWRCNFSYYACSLFMCHCFLPHRGTSNDEMCNFYIMYYMDNSRGVPYMNCGDDGSSELFRNIPSEANIPIPVSPDHMMSMKHESAPHKGTI